VKSLLVTGGSGFIGSNFIRYIYSTYPDTKIINLDILTYAGNPENLADIEEVESAAQDRRYVFIKGDIRDETTVKYILMEQNVDAIINFAAESHVDRSILGPKLFVDTNVMGTMNLLNCAKNAWLDKNDDLKEDGKVFLQVSTDEVYGSLGPEGYFTEETNLNPNSPYSASKASADMIVRAYNKTYGLPTLTTRCSNNYGPYQFPEKLIPLMIKNALDDKPLPVYGDGLNIRDWLHVYDHSSAIDTVLQKGRPGEVYNIGGNNEKANIEIVKLILNELGKPESLISYVTDRKGHDRRYAIDSSKMKRELGWEPSYTFEQGIQETIDWYLNNKGWLSNVISGEYMKYYEKNYEGRGL
jgi:dTDP-glucose 4,6-dehydratase